MAVGLTVDGQSLDIDGAWEHDLSLGRLLGSVRTRGSNRRVPGAQGVIARPLRKDEVVVDLQLEVYGSKDETGAAHADYFAGLSDNLIYLREWVEGLADGSTETYTALLEVPGGRQFTTDAQIINWQVARHDVTIAYVSYDLRIPSGTWTEVP